MLFWIAVDDVVDQAEDLLKRLVGTSEARGHARTPDGTWDYQILVLGPGTQADPHHHPGAPLTFTVWVEDARHDVQWTDINQDPHDRGEVNGISGVAAELDDFLAYIDGLTAQASQSTARSFESIQRDIEAFVHLWWQMTSDLPLSPDERRTGDALARMVADISMDGDPPVSVLRAAFVWFSQRTSIFVDEFTKAAGKTAGAAAGVGAVAGATGQLPRLASAANRVLEALGGG
ncbi:MAG: hypothetical protein GY788_16200 [bacterium]|nr:hypothetical protein [bacterium]